MIVFIKLWGEAPWSRSSSGEYTDTGRRTTSTLPGTFRPDGRANRGSKALPLSKVQRRDGNLLSGTNRKVTCTVSISSSIVTANKRRLEPYF
jgi:hypothetical protein